MSTVRHNIAGPVQPVRIASKALEPAIALANKVGAVASKPMDRLKSAFRQKEGIKYIGSEVLKGLKKLGSDVLKGLKKIGDFFRFVFGAPKRCINSMKHNLAAMSTQALHVIGYRKASRIIGDNGGTMGDRFNEFAYTYEDYDVNRFGIKAHLARAELNYRKDHKVSEEF